MIGEQVCWTKTLAHVRVGSADQVRAELKKSRTRLNWRVPFAPEALDQLRRLKKHFANGGAPMTAERYVDSIVDFCMKLQTFPARGSHVTICCHRTSRVPHFRKRAIIAYLLEAEAVSIVNVFYGNQDYEATLARDEDQQSTLIGGDDSCRSERNLRSIDMMNISDNNVGMVSKRRVNGTARSESLLIRGRSSTLLKRHPAEPI